ncbi:MAG: hypothetical protein COA32_14320 [Fluviicola sp.]|nr:MAG: hypothetical protein COA32_14320 [Fluviicola sp.]
MQKETNSHILLADFSKSFNAFRWVYSILFPLFGFVSLLIFLIFFLKSFGYTNEQLFWIPIFNAEKFPFEERIIEYIGMGILFLMGVLFVLLGGIYFFLGKVSYVYYDNANRTLLTIRNGTSKKETIIPIDEIKYLRKKRDKRSPNSISTGQHRIQTLSLQNNRAFAIIKGTNKYVYLFEYYDKKKFDNTFREINKFIKDKKK